MSARGGDPTPAPAAPAPAAAGGGLGRGALALVDQALVSGTSFATGILLGRFAGEEQLGLYSLGFTFLVVVVCLQDALVLAPYTVLAPRRSAAERAVYAGHVLLHHLLLAGLSAVGFGAAAVAAGLGGASGLAPVLAVLALAAPCVLLRELRRRLAFAHLDFRSAVALDGATTCLQLGGLGILAGLGLLTAGAAHAAAGLACLLAGGVALLAGRRLFELRRAGVWRELARSWGFGRWIVAGQLVGVVHGFVLLWLFGLFLGAAETGRFAACLAVVSLSNPLVFGLGNWLGPRLAHAASVPDGNTAELRALVARANGVVGTAMAGFTLVVLTVGDPLLGLLYGPAYAGQAATVRLLALAYFVLALSTGTDFGLRALERPDLSFASGLAGLAVTVGAAAALIPAFGSAGGAAGHLLGCASCALLRVCLFRALAAPAIRGGVP